MYLDTLASKINALLPPSPHTKAQNDHARFTLFFFRLGACKFTETPATPYTAWLRQNIRHTPNPCILLIYVDIDSLTAVLSGSSLAAVAEERGKLARCWRRLPLRHRLRLLEGLPEVKKEATAAAGGESSSGGQGCDDVVGDLVLAPAALCFKVRATKYFCPFKFEKVLCT